MRLGLVVCIHLETACCLQVHICARPHSRGGLCHRRASHGGLAARQEPHWAVPTRKFAARQQPCQVRHSPVPSTAKCTHHPSILPLLRPAVFAAKLSLHAGNLVATTPVACKGSGRLQQHSGEGLCWWEAAFHAQWMLQSMAKLGHLPCELLPQCAMNSTPLPACRGSSPTGRFFTAASPVGSSPHAKRGKWPLLEQATSVQMLAGQRMCLLPCTMMQMMENCANALRCQVCHQVPAGAPQAVGISPVWQLSTSQRRIVSDACIACRCKELGGPRGT